MSTEPSIQIMRAYCGRCQNLTECAVVDWPRGGRDALDAAQALRDARRKP